MHKRKRLIRAVARSENPGGHVVLGGDNVPPRVEIGLSDLPKTGGAHAPPPAPPLATGLGCKYAGTPTVEIEILDHIENIILNFQI